MRKLFDRVSPYLAGVTVAGILFLHPALEFLESNPYFAFRYGFDDTHLALVLLVFGVVPWILFVLLFRGRPGGGRARLAVALVLLLFLSQIDSMALSAAPAWQRLGALTLGVLVGVALLRRRRLAPAGPLALVSLVVVPLVGMQVGETWWRIPRQPEEPTVPAAGLRADGDVYVFFLDGSTLTVDHLDDDALPDARAFPHLRRFIQEDAHWFPHAVSNGPSTVTSAPSIFTGRMYASRLNNLLANEETIFTMVRSRFEVRSWLHTKGFFCVGPNFELCYPFEPKSHGKALAVLVNSYGYLSSFRLIPLSYPIGAFNSSGYSRDDFVGDFMRRLRSPEGPRRFYTIQLFDRGLEGLRDFDDLFGRVVATLSRHGRYEESIIVLLSDHGLIVEGEKFLYGRQVQQLPRLYRVPFAIKPPGTGQGRIYDYPAQGIDFVPTLLARILPEEEYDARDYDGVDVLTTRPEREHYINMTVRGKLFRFADDPGEGLVAVPRKQTGY